MRRIHMGVLLAALAALIVTSIAVADENKPTTSAAVSAHFSATGNVKSSACPNQSDQNKGGDKAAGGTGSTSPSSSNIVTRGQLSGTSTSTEKRVNGSVRISLRLVVNRNGLGFATGSFHVGNRIDAELMAVVTNSNKLDGFLRGTKGGPRAFAANFSATLTGSTLTGDLGSGSHTNTAVIGFGTC